MKYFLGLLLLFVSSCQPADDLSSGSDPSSSVSVVKNGGAGKCGLKTPQTVLGSCSSSIPNSQDADEIEFCGPDGELKIECKLISCESKFEAKGNACIPTGCIPNETVSLYDCKSEIANAGEAVREIICDPNGKDSHDTGCVAASCQSGYVLRQNQCVQPICLLGTSTTGDCKDQITNAASATKTLVCDAGGTEYRQVNCILNNCNTGFVKIGNSCPASLCAIGVNLPNLACTADIANATLAERTQTCSAGGTAVVPGDCTVVSCAAYFMRFQNSCVKIPQTTNAKIDGGPLKTIVVKNNASAVGVGSNIYGSLGLGDDATAGTSWGQIIANAKTVSVFGNHGMIVTNTGDLYSFGYNQQQLGDNSTTHLELPTNVMSAVALADTGENFSVVLKNDGAVWTFGKNAYGQLGNGTNTTSGVPTKIMMNVLQISVGKYHALILKSDFTLWAFGHNYWGQLGDNTTTNKNSAVQIAANVKSIFAYDAASFYTTLDDKLYAFGYNKNGRLGLGNVTNYNSPQFVMDGVKSVATGAGHSLFLKTDGTLLAVGLNANGQLGDGTTSNSLNAVGIAANVKEVAAGDNHSLFIKDDDTLWAFGKNNGRQLGDGTNIDRSSPVQVYDLSK